MLIISTYQSPVGVLTLASKNDKLLGLWIEGQKHFLSVYKDEQMVVGENAVIEKTKKWLDCYFAGQNPEIEKLEIEFFGSEFSQEVFKRLCRIPCGSVTTYKSIAGDIARYRGLKSMSCQAVGNAVGRNPISIIVPCHRVVGSDGGLTGYAGGIAKKKFLLELEGIPVEGDRVKEDCIR